MNSHFLNGFAHELIKVGIAMPSQGTNYSRDTGRAPVNPYPAASPKPQKAAKPKGSGLTSRQQKIVDSGGTAWQKAIRKSGVRGSQARKDFLAKGKDSWKSGNRANRQSALANRFGGKPTGKQTGFNASGKHQFKDKAKADAAFAKVKAGALGEKPAYKPSTGMAAMIANRRRVAAGGTPRDGDPGYKKPTGLNRAATRQQNEEPSAPKRIAKNNSHLGPEKVNTAFKPKKPSSGWAAVGNRVKSFMTGAQKAKATPKPPAPPKRMASYRSAPSESPLRS